MADLWSKSIFTRSFPVLILDLESVLQISFGLYLGRWRHRGRH